MLAHTKNKFFRLNKKPHYTNEEAETRKHTHHSHTTSANSIHNEYLHLFND